MFLKSGVAIFDLGPWSKVIEVNILNFRPYLMLTSITFDQGPKSKIATPDFKNSVWGSCLPSFKAQLRAVSEQSEDMCEKCEFWEKRKVVWLGIKLTSGDQTGDLHSWSFDLEQPPKKNPGAWNSGAIQKVPETPPVPEGIQSTLTFDMIYGVVE